MNRMMDSVGIGRKLLPQSLIGFGSVRRIRRSEVTDVGMRHREEVHNEPPVQAKLTDGSVRFPRIAFWSWVRAVTFTVVGTFTVLMMIGGLSLYQESLKSPASAKEISVIATKIAELHSKGLQNWEPSLHVKIESISELARQFAKSGMMTKSQASELLTLLTDIDEQIERRKAYRDLANALVFQPKTEAPLPAAPAPTNISATEDFSARVSLPTPNSDDMKNGFKKIGKQVPVRKNDAVAHTEQPRNKNKIEIVGN